MSKRTVAGLIALGVAGLLLWAWSYRSTDARIRARMVGTWAADNDPSTLIENKPDGTFVVTRQGAESARGVWHIQHGFSVATVTNVAFPDGRAQVERNRVLSIVGKKMVILSTDGRIQLTYYRQ